MRVPMVHHCELIGTNESEECKLHLQGPISCRYCNARKFSRSLMYGVVSKSPTYFVAMLHSSWKMWLEKEEFVEESYVVFQTFGSTS